MSNNVVNIFSVCSLTMRCSIKGRSLELRIVLIHVTVSLAALGLVAIIAMFTLCKVKTIKKYSLAIALNLPSPLQVTPNNQLGASNIWVKHYFEYDSFDVKVSFELHDSFYTMQVRKGINFVQSINAIETLGQDSTLLTKILKLVSCLPICQSVTLCVNWLFGASYRMRLNEVGVTASVCEEISN